MDNFSEYIKYLLKYLIFLDLESFFVIIEIVFFGVEEVDTMKMTYQPKKRHRAKVHGFRKRMWKKSIGSKKIKRKKENISLGHNLWSFLLLSGSSVNI